METIKGRQPIKQLEKRKGGYYYLKIDKEVVDQLTSKRSTRLICEIDQKISYRCGLNHLGDGNFYIIVSGKFLDQLGKKVGDQVEYEITEDPDQLGVDMPEVLTVFLDQDEQMKSIFEQLSGGKKRSLIYSFNKIKDLDKQVNIIIKFLTEEGQKLRKKG